MRLNGVDFYADIVDGKETLVLGMVFQIIIQYFKVEDEDGNSSNDVKEALLLWYHGIFPPIFFRLKNKTAGYRDVNIENFTKSFHDGLAFCALIHK